MLSWLLCGTRAVAITVLVGVWSITCAWATDGGIVLAPHRAVYDMTLAKARGGASIVAVVGRMVYELTGSVCEGYTENMRFVTQMTSQSGDDMVADQRASTWEDGDAKRFRFSSSEFRDGKSTEDTAGDAARLNASDQVKVELSKPGTKNLSLSAGIYFPTQHTIAILTAAKEGKKSFHADVYDGSEKGEKDLQHGVHHRRTGAAGCKPEN